MLVDAEFVLLLHADTGGGRHQVRGKGTPVAHAEKLPLALQAQDSLEREAALCAALSGGPDARLHDRPLVLFEGGTEQLRDVQIRLFALELSLPLPAQRLGHLALEPALLAAAQALALRLDVCQEAPADAVAAEVLDEQLDGRLVHDGGRDEQSLAVAVVPEGQLLVDGQLGRRA